jgi:tetratricopeptide (TPR) repeat protein
MDFDDQIKKLLAFRGDTESLALATVDIVVGAQGPELKRAIEIAAVPHWFNTRILSELLQSDSETAERVVASLRSLPMVETFASRNGLNVHEATRLALRNYLANEKPEFFRSVSALAVQAFKAKDPSHEVEQIYHRLVAEPDKSGDALESLWEKWYYAGRHELIQALGVALAELIRTNLLAPGPRARATLRLAAAGTNRLSLRERKQFTEESLGLFQSLGHRPGELDARDQLGDLLKAEGNDSKATREYRACQEIAEQLLKEDPTNTTWQRNLSIGHSKLGRVLEAQELWEPAFAEFQKSKQIRQQLTELDPKNNDWKCDLSIAHNNLGRILEQQRKFEPAVEEYKAYKETLQDLVSQDPDNTQWQRELAVSFGCMGSVLKALGKERAALDEYVASHKIITELTKKYPGHSEWQRDLAISHFDIGRALEAQGDLSNAFSEFESYREIMLKLTKLDPENLNWQRLLFNAYHCVGRVLRALGDLSGSLEMHERAHAVISALARRDSAKTQWQADLNRAEHSLTDVRNDLKRVRESLL